MTATIPVPNTAEQTSSTCELLRGSHASTLADFLKLNNDLQGLDFEIMAWSKKNLRRYGSDIPRLGVPYLFGKNGLISPTLQTNCFSRPSFEYTPYHLARGFYSPRLTMYVPCSSDGEPSGMPEFTEGAFFTTLDDLIQGGKMRRLYERSSMNDTFALGILIECHTGLVLPFARDTRMEVTITPADNGKYVSFRVKNHLLPLDDTGLSEPWCWYLYKDNQEAQDSQNAKARNSGTGQTDEEIHERIMCKMREVAQGTARYREATRQPILTLPSASSQKNGTARDELVQQSDEAYLFRAQTQADTPKEDPLPQYFNGIAFDGGVGEWRNESGTGCRLGNTHPCREEPRYYIDILCADSECMDLHHATYCPRHMEDILSYYLNMLHRWEYLSEKPKYQAPKYRDSGLVPCLWRIFGCGEIKRPSRCAGTLNVAGNSNTKIPGDGKE